MRKHVEMIIDYLEHDENFEYFDNRGILTRCCECKRATPSAVTGHLDCERFIEVVRPDDYCSRAMRANGDE